MAEARQFGRYFEDFEVGDVYKHWPGKTITEFDDHLFCMITMNHHPLHTNAHYAETSTQFKRNVVVGNLVYSLALGMSVPDVSGKAIANLEVETLQHKAPMFHGDTLYAETTRIATPSSRRAENSMGRTPCFTALDNSSNTTRSTYRWGTPYHTPSSMATTSAPAPIRCTAASNALSTSVTPSGRGPEATS